jgi:hypothetical protein
MSERRKQEHGFVFSVCVVSTLSIRLTMKETPRRRITLTSSLTEINTDQLGNRVVWGALLPETHINRLATRHDCLPSGAMGTNKVK